MHSNPFIYSSTQITMKTGAGIAEFDSNSNKSQTLKSADDALYCDKQNQPKSLMKPLGSVPAGEDVLKFPMR